MAPAVTISSDQIRDRLQIKPQPFKVTMDCELKKEPVGPWPNSKPGSSKSKTRVLKYALIFTLALFISVVESGCKTSESSGPIEQLKEASKNMQSASKNFVAALKEVVDEPSAQAAKLKLQEISQEMFEAGKDFELAMGTQSRLATAIKKEATDFRREQKMLVDEQVKRIKKIPAAEKVLKEILEKTKR